MGIARALAIQIRAIGRWARIDHFILIAVISFLSACAFQSNGHLPVELQRVAISDPDLAKEFSVGVAAWEAADWRKSVDVWERLYALSDGKYGKDHAATNLAAFYLGDTYRRMQKYRQALPLLLQASAASEQLLGPDHLYTASAFNSLAAAYQSTGQLDKALTTALEALRINELRKGRNSDEFATSLIYVGSILFSQGRYEEALKYQRGAYKIWQDIYGRIHAKPNLAMSEIAQSQFALGLYKDALETQQLVLQLGMQLGPSQYDANLIALSNVASTHQVMGNFAMALSAHKKALDLAIRKYGDGHPRSGGVMANLAVCYYEMGNLPLAEAYFRAAIRIDEDTYGIDSVEVASNLENLAELQLDSMQIGEALATSERAIKIYQKKLGAESLRTFKALKRYANFLRASGKLQEAKDLQQLALEVTEEQWGVDHIETARAKGNLGITLSIMGDHQSGFNLKLDSLRIIELTFGDSHYEVATALENLASDVEFLYGTDASIALRKRAVNILQVSRQDVSKVGANELTTYTKRLEPTYQKLAALLTDSGRISEAQQVLDMLKESEQFEFTRRNEGTVQRRPTLGYTQQEKAWVMRYGQISQQLASLGAEERTLSRKPKSTLTPLEQQRLSLIQRDLQVAKAAFANFMGQMREGFVSRGPAREVETLETSADASIELQGLVRSLGEDVVLVQYYVTEDMLGMLLTTSGVQLARKVNISDKDLNRQVAALRRALRDPKVDPLPSAKSLYKVLFAPIENDLAQADAKTVMLSLDGSLRYLPFGALHDGQYYAAQKWKLPMYTSVVRDRLRDPASAKWRAVGLGVTRAIGDFSALPAVRSEMSSIVKVGDSAGLLPGEVHLDEEFDVKRLKDVGRSKIELLHVASHFRFSPGTEANSFLLLGDGQQLTLGEIRSQNFRFDNVDLLTLSACDTGLGGGRDEKGREIEGLGVMAQQQGAKAVLATLWPVADQSTASIMADMYRRRQEFGLSKIDALRQAQIALMQQPKYAHPFYWAPYIIMGNWK